MSHHKLDAKNLLCPMPVIRLQDKLRHLQAGDTVTVYGTDPGTVHDIPTWCRLNGHIVCEQRKENNVFIFELEVG